MNKTMIYIKTVLMLAQKKSRLEVINTISLREMRDLGIEDTPENRYTFYKELRGGWQRDPDTSDEKALWMETLTQEIERLETLVDHS